MNTVTAVALVLIGFGLAMLASALMDVYLLKKIEKIWDEVKK